MKGRNNEIEGIRFFLSLTVIQVHHISAYWGNGQSQAPWLAVNGFFVLSAFLAVGSLDSSWRRWKTRQAVQPSLTVATSDQGTPQVSKSCSKLDVVIDQMSPVEAISNIEGFEAEIKRSYSTRLLLQYVEFVVRRIPPFVWVTWALILLLSPYDPDSLVTRLFSFKRFPLTNFWGMSLRGSDKDYVFYKPDPVYWYMCNLTLFLICAPILYQLLRIIKKIPLWTPFKCLVFLSLPIATIVADYFVVRALTFPDLEANANRGAAAYALQHSPLAYAGKFASAMMAAVLWSDWKRFPYWLSWVPVIDLLIMAQIAWMLSLEPHRWIEASWMLLYISAFTPGHCLIIWAIIKQVGCQFPLRRMLGSRYVNMTSHGCSLFVYLLHMPVHRRWFGCEGWNSTGTVCTTFVTYLLAIHVQDGHNQLLKHYNKLIGRMFQSLDRRF